MKVLCQIVLIFVLVGTSLQNQSSDDVLASQLRLFSGNIYSHITASNQTNGNIIISPISIYNTLGMVLAGAKSTTSQQIQNAMQLANVNKFRITSLLNKLYNKATEEGTGQTLVVANAMFADQHFPFEQTYLSTLQNRYKAFFQSVNMDNIQQTLEIVNDWVANRTRDKITTILDHISPLSRLILVNAMYFNAQWKYPFSNYEERFDFTTANGNIVYPQAMILTAMLPYISTNEMNFYAIPYSSLQNQTTYLVIGIPTFSVFPLSTFNAEAGEILQSLPAINSWNKRKINLKMPKFEIDFEIDLKNILRQMGVVSLFVNPDLSLISKRNGLYVSQFKHKAYIDVNEEGTEAAAVTMVVADERSFLIPANVEINRPFFFGIYSEAVNAYTFLGKVDNPR